MNFLGAIHVLWLFLSFCVSFVSGSIPFSVWIGKLLKGRDPRKYNIGNPGGFNSFITFGPAVGFTIIYLDFLKGTFAIALLDQLFSLDYFVAPDGSNIWHTLVCIFGPMFCVLGHNYSPWLNFQGGRGIGVFIGTLLYVNPIIFVIFFFVSFHLLIGIIKVSPRIANIFAFFIYFPATLFIPLAPPWSFIWNDWVVGANNLLHLTPALMTIAIWIAWIPSHWRSLVYFFKGKKEWTFSMEEGQKLEGDFGTVKDQTYTDPSAEEEP